MWLQLIIQIPPAPVKRKNVKRTIQLQSNVLDPTMAGKVNEQLAIKD